jgi:hypothetical protein
LRWLLAFCLQQQRLWRRQSGRTPKPLNPADLHYGGVHHVCE